MSKDRNCKMCVYHSENGCSQFNCQGTTTVDDIKADERAKVINEVDTIIDFIKNNSFDHNLEFDSLKVIGSSVVISLLEQLKERNNGNNNIPS